jgi:methyl-accepting chemotaxis protein
VPSAPGEFATIKQSVDEILGKLEKIDAEKIGELIEEILVSVDDAIEDANVPAVSKRLQDLLATADRTVEDANLPGVADEIKRLFAEARVSNEHLKKLLASKKPDSDTSDIPEVVTQLNTTLRRIDRLIAGQTPQIEQALENLREISENLEEITENLKKHPSQLIFSKPPPKSEVLE